MKSTAFYLDTPIRTLCKQSSFRALLLFGFLLALLSRPISVHARFGFPNCEDVLFLPLPVITQGTSYTCGVACMDSALRFLRGFSPGEWALAAAMGSSPMEGTSGPAIVQMARQYGLFSFEHKFATVVDLRRYLAAGEVVIVAWSSGGSPHYSIVRGLGPNHITLMDPWHAIAHPWQYNRMWLSEFVPSWHDGFTSFGAVIRVSNRPLIL